MPPRRRPKKRRLLRIHGAIDAMLPLGFTAEQVRKSVKELLREYGGDEAWPFIEDSYYSELREAILRDVEREKQEQVGRDGEEVMQDSDQMKDNGGDKDPAETSNRASDSHQDERSQENSLAEHVSPEPVLSTSDGKGWKDILPDLTSAHVEAEILVSKNDEDPTRKLVSPRKSKMPVSHRRRLPCYGWIESDEEDDDGDDVLLTTLPLEMDESLKEKMQVKIG